MSPRRAASEPAGPASRVPARGEATPAFVYAPELADVGAEIELSDDESHYVARVCRVREGEVVTASDGRGRRAGLRVLARPASRVPGRVRARVETLEHVPRGRRGWLMSGAPEGSRDDWEVEKLAELGVERWIPIECERGAWPAASRRAARWERLATMAMKQSRSAHRLEIAAPRPLDAALRDVPADADRWLASESGGSPEAAVSARPWVGVVGPAAGLTPGEEGLLIGQGFQPIRLARQRLRTETAALALAALMGLPAALPGVSASEAG